MKGRFIFGQSVLNSDPKIKYLLKKNRGKPPDFINIENIEH